MNNQLTWKNNYYSRMYTAGEARIIETQTIPPFPVNPDQPVELIIQPVDPGSFL